MCETNHPFHLLPVSVLTAIVMVCVFWGALFLVAWEGYRLTHRLEARVRHRPALAPVVAAAVAAPNPSRSLGPDSVEKARTLMEEGKFKEARIEAKNAVQAEPSRSTAYMTLGEASLRCGLKKEALEAFKKAADLGSYDGAAQMILSRLALAAGDSHEGLRWAEAAAAAAPNSAVVLTLLSEVQEMCGDPKKACATAERAHEVNPLDTNAVLRLAAVDLTVGNTAESERLYKTLLASNPGHLPSRVGLARVQLVRKDFDGAVEELQDVLKSNPDNVVALQEISTAYLEKSDFKSLEDLYKRFTGKHQQLFGLRAQMALAMLSAGRVNAAYDEASGLLTDHPDDVNAHLILGELFLRLDLWTLADQHARLVIAHDQKIGAGHRLAARVLMRQGFNDRALVELTAAQKMEPNDLSTILLLASCLHELKRDSEATALLEGAGKDHPETPVPFEHLGELHMRSANYAAAAADFRKALACNGTNAVALNNLATALVRVQGPSDEALGMAVRAKGLLPGNPLVSDTLGWIYLERKEYQKAAELLEAAAIQAPQQPTICLHFGSLLCATGQPARAEPYLKRVVERSHDAEEIRKAKTLLKAMSEKEGDAQQGHG